MEIFQAAVIGGGPEGLIAAAILARAGLSVVLLEKNRATGGRAATFEFHPGFRASPYADELPAIPRRLFHALDLAHNGALLVPSPASVCLSEHGVSALFADDMRTRSAAPSDSRDGYFALRRHVQTTQEAIAARSAMISPSTGWLGFGRRGAAAPWPGDDWSMLSLDDVLRARIGDPGLRLHLAADAIAGRAASPFLTGSALHLLAPGAGRSGWAAGGLGSLAAALTRVAQATGVSVRCNAVVAGIATRWGRARTVTTASGDTVAARAIISALDLKRTLRLFPPEELSPVLKKVADAFRMAGQAARVLFALDAPPELALARECLVGATGPIHVVNSIHALSAARDSWRAGEIPSDPLVTLRFPSLGDPRMAPAGKGVMTATVSGVPPLVVNGAWDDSKRERIAAIALAAAERVVPGIGTRVVASRTLVAADIELELGLTAGDLDGGELVADQVFGFRPSGSTGWRDGRTPIRGLYLAGPSASPSPMLLGASGARAAHAVIADIQGRTWR